MAKEIPGAHLVGDFGQKALITKNGKVLMCRGLGDPRWDFPGGRLHKNEDLGEGLKREVVEEVGVEVEVGEPFFVTVWYGSRSGLPRILVVYCATLVDPNKDFTLAADEIEEVRWVGEDEVDSLNMDALWKQALKKFYQHK